MRQSCYRSYQFFHQSREGDSDSGTEYKYMQIPSTLALPSIFHSVCVQNFTLVWQCFRSFHDCYCWSFGRKIRKLIARQLDNGFQLNPRGVPCSHALCGHEGSTWRHMPVNWCCREASLSRPGHIHVSVVLRQRQKQIKTLDMFESRQNIHIRIHICIYIHV